MPADGRSVEMRRVEDTGGTEESKYVFVGEKRSRRAVEMSVTWEHERLCGKTIAEALREAGIEPRACLFVNLFLDGDGWELDGAALARLREAAAAGSRVVGLGRRVQRALSKAGVPHIELYHPAARGAIRGAEYRRHVAAVLGQGGAASS